ncbi:hypothetical protein PG985_016422 [Apiospora marii]|uniref:uncharacterized protein n=1 Tax=Apiospora marii TaxID=335849 RepID=UPI003131867C
MSYNPYNPYYQWGQDRFANRPSAYIRPGVVDWRSPGRNYPGYDPTTTTRRRGCGPKTSRRGRSS